MKPEKKKRVKRDENRIKEDNIRKEGKIWFEKSWKNVMKTGEKGNGRE